MTKLDTQEARETLAALLPKGSTIYTLVRSVAPSGMSRRISVFTVVGGEIFELDWFIDRAGIFKHRGDKSGLYIQGCGMDMTFHLSYTLGSLLHDDGYTLTNRNL